MYVMIPWNSYFVQYASTAFTSSAQKYSSACGPGKKTLAIDYHPSVCQQINRKGCGVFANTFAFHVCM